MNLRAFCPACQSHVPAPSSAQPWPCPNCDHQLTPAPSEQAAQGKPLPACQFCGETEVYVQKDFPHWLGLSILLAAVVASFVAYAYHLVFWTWVILIGSALVDGLLFWIVGNVTVCYRCLAQHRDYPPNPDHKPFDLGVGEKYRQERLRRQPVSPDATERREA
jgi:hypothetical protein